MLPVFPCFKILLESIWQCLNNPCYDDLVDNIETVRIYGGFFFKTPILNNGKLNGFSYSKSTLPSVFIFFLKTNFNYNKSTHNRIILKRKLSQ